MIFLFTILSLSENENETPSGIPFDQLERKIDEFVEPCINKTTPSASIIVTHNGENIFSKAYGYSNIEKKEKATVNHLYEWGSMTKILTHVSIFQLYESGNVSLDEDIETYLGKNFFKRRRFSEKITIKHLMHHNAGWEDFVFDSIGLTKETLNLSEYILSVEPRQFAKPGEHVAYSNYGVTVEGAIVERITGMPFSKYVKENILNVLGMNQTTIDPLRSDIPNYSTLPVATGYSVIDGKFVEFTKTQYKILCYPAGAGVGPVTDLAIFFKELIPRKNQPCRLFKNPDTLSKFLNISYRRCPECTGISHGLWEEFYGGKDGLTKISGFVHGGNTMAFSAQSSILPDYDWSIHVLTNADGEAFVTDGLHSIIYGNYTGKTDLTMEDTGKKVEGYYKSYRAQFHGLLKNYYAFSNTYFKAPSDFTVFYDKIPERQMQPYHYYFLKATNNVKYYHQHFLRDENGKVIGYYMKYVETYKTSKSSIIFSQFVIFLTVAFFILGIILLIVLPILRFVYHKKHPKHGFIKQLDIYFIIGELINLFITFEIITFLFLIPQADLTGNIKIVRNIFTTCLVFHILIWLAFLSIIPAILIIRRSIPNTFNYLLKDPMNSEIDDDDNNNSNNLDEGFTCFYKTIKVFVGISISIGPITNILGLVLDIYRF